MAEEIVYEEVVHDSIEIELDENYEEYEPEEYFNHERTSMLIELFKKYKPLVAVGSIKTMKRMWEIICVDMTNKYQINLSPSKCENRFKVLERGYKRMKDALDSGKEIKKMFPYYEEFKEVPRNKKYAIVPGLNSTNYSNYTAVNFNNTIPDVTPLTYVELSNVKQDLEESSTRPIISSQSENTYQNVQVGVDIYFNRERTLTLIELYKQYNQKYRERAIKTKRRMWYLIAREMTNRFNTLVTGAKCENKLKVLERNYKRSTSLKKRYEFEEELRGIFADRVIKPEIKKPSTIAAAPSTATAPQQVTIRVLDPQAAKTEKIESILTGIRNDFQIYYRERLNIEREKLSLKRKKLIYLKENTIQRKKNLPKK